MSTAPEETVEVRCFCAREPLLALAGRDKQGKPYVHTKVYKGKKLYSEVIAVEGIVLVRCRDCYRWHRITIKSDVHVAEAKLPSRIPVA